MAGKNNRLGSGEISNMFDFSHGLNRPQPTLTTDPYRKPVPGRLGGVHMGDMTVAEEAVNISRILLIFL